jgi:hypothetical protein
MLYRNGDRHDADDDDTITGAAVLTGGSGGRPRQRVEDLLNRTNYAYLRPTRCRNAGGTPVVSPLLLVAIGTLLLGTGLACLLVRKSP